MPVKIFSGVDYIVEKSINKFIKDVKVLDIQISSHVHNEKPQVSVIIHYEGNAPDHAAGPGLL
ncbi:MAG: hypothetical protein R3230_02505 [Nitrosopumilaceae archaeon]|nr:hypothetical protein [Nitrosopumilaceae archaeon]